MTCFSSALDVERFDERTCFRFVERTCFSSALDVERFVCPLFLVSSLVRLSAHATACTRICLHKIQIGILVLELSINVLTLSLRYADTSSSRDPLA